LFFIAKRTTESLPFLRDGGFHGADVTKQREGDSYCYCPGDCRVTGRGAASAQRIAGSDGKLQAGLPEVGSLF